MTEILQLSCGDTIIARYDTSFCRIRNVADFYYSCAIPFLFALARMTKANPDGQSRLHVKFGDLVNVLDIKYSKCIYIFPFDNSIEALSSKYLPKS